MLKRAKEQIKDNYIIPGMHDNNAILALTRVRIRVLHK